MARGKPADAGDAIGLQRRHRVFHRGDPVQMRAVGAGPRHQFDMAVEQQRRAKSCTADTSALMREIMVF